jgi:hypothetical protein
MWLQQHQWATFSGNEQETRLVTLRVALEKADGQGHPSAKTIERYNLVLYGTRRFYSFFIEMADFICKVWWTLS